MKGLLKLSAIIAVSASVTVFSGCSLISANPTGRWQFTSEDIRSSKNDTKHVGSDEMPSNLEYVLFKDGTGQIAMNGTAVYRLTYDYDDKGVTMHIDDQPINSVGINIESGTHDNYFSLSGDNYRLGAEMKYVAESTETDPESGETVKWTNELTFTKKL